MGSQEHMRDFIVSFLVAATAANAQFVSFGFKGGVPLMDPIRKERYTPSWTMDTGRWTIGPTVEFRLYRRLSLEVDALFRGYRLGGSYPASPGPGLSPVLYTTRWETKAWDFPLLLKYRFLNRRWQPFVVAGISVSHESTDGTSRSECLGPTSCSLPDLPDPIMSSTHSDSINRRGIVAGGGVEFKHGRATFAPEFRYTRLQNLSTNQATILFGVRF